MNLFDHHIHSNRSDGRVSLEDRAKSVAIRPHGVSDHYPYPGSMQDDDDILRYLDDASRLGLQVGIEYDLGVAPPLLSSTHKALDYVIGSVHQVVVGGRIDYSPAGYFLKGRGGTSFGDAQRFADPELQRRILEQHFELVRVGVLHRGIDIVGHPTFSPLAALGDPEAAYPIDWQERLIALCVENGVALEINEAYGVPHRAFLVRAHLRGARFSVGSDTHFELLPLDKTEAMIAAAGIAADERGRFLDGTRVRQEGVSRASSS
jgi:histidinol phosphatase-like PHP family hydrolase